MTTCTIESCPAAVRVEAVAENIYACRRVMDVRAEKSATGIWLKFDIGGRETWGDWARAVWIGSHVKQREGPHVGWDILNRSRIQCDVFTVTYSASFPLASRSRRRSHRAGCCHDFLKR